VLLKSCKYLRNNFFLNISNLDYSRVEVGVDTEISERIGKTGTPEKTENGKWKIGKNREMCIAKFEMLG